MLLKFGTEVLNSDDKKIGELESVIVDPKTEEITHLVVRKGMLPTKDKLVPVSLVAQSDEHRIKLYEFEGTVEDLEDYLKTMFVPLESYINDELDGKVIPMVFYPPLGTPVAYASHMTGLPMVQKKLATDKESIQEGAEVFGMEGEKIGKVQEVVLDPETDRVTHLLISEGLLVKHKYLIPVDWVRSIDDSEIDLYVNDRLVKNLPHYQGRGEVHP